MFAQLSDSLTLTHALLHSPPLETRPEHETRCPHGAQCAGKAFFNVFESGRECILILTFLLGSRTHTHARAISITIMCGAPPGKDHMCTACNWYWEKLLCISGDLCSRTHTPFHLSVRPRARAQVQHIASTPSITARWRRLNSSNNNNNATPTERAWLIKRKPKCDSINWHGIVLATFLCRAHAHYINNNNIVVWYSGGTFMLG